MVAALLMIPSDIVRACRDAEAVHGAGPLRASSSCRGRAAHPTVPGAGPGAGARSHVRSARQGRGRTGQTGFQASVHALGRPRAPLPRAEPAARGQHEGSSGPLPGLTAAARTPTEARPRGGGRGARAGGGGGGGRRQPEHPRLPTPGSTGSGPGAAGPGFSQRGLWQGRLRSAAPGLPGRRLPGPGAVARSPGLYPGPPDPASPTCTAPAPLGPPTRRLRCPDPFRPGRTGSSVRIRAGGAGRRNRR